MGQGAPLLPAPDFRGLIEAAVAAIREQVEAGLADRDARIAIGILGNFGWATPRLPEGTRKTLERAAKVSAIDPAELGPVLAAAEALERRLSLGTLSEDRGADPAAREVTRL